MTDPFASDDHHGSAVLSEHPPTRVEMDLVAAWVATRHLPPTSAEAMAAYQALADVALSHSRMVALINRWWIVEQAKAIVGRVADAGFVAMVVWCAVALVRDRRRA